MSMLVAGLIGAFGRLNEHQKLKEAAYFEGLDKDDDEAKITVKDFNDLMSAQPDSQKNKFFRQVFPKLDQSKMDPTALAMGKTLMNSVDKDERSYGNLIFSVGSSTDSKQYEEFLTGASGVFKTQAGIDAVSSMRSNNPEAYENLVSDTAYNGKQWITNWISDRNENIDGGINTPILSRFFTPFLKDKMFARDLAEALGTDGNLNTFHIEMGTDYFKNKNKSELTPVVTFQGFETNEGTQKIVHQQLNDKDALLLREFSNLVGMTDQQLVANYPFKLDNEIRKNTKQSIIKGYAPLSAAFRLKNKNFAVEKLDPQASQQLTNESMHEISSELINLFGRDGDFSNPKAMMGAILPFMTTALKAEGANQTPGQYVARASAATYFKQQTGVDPKDLNDPNGGFQAAQKSFESLTRIRSLMGTTELAGTAERFVSGIRGTFGSGGFVAQLVGVFNREVSVEAQTALQSSITMAFEEDERRKAAGVSDSNLGELQALRVVAAFEMARAFDPSGRLSNMDVEMQMARLGGIGFLSVEKAQAQLDVAIKDVSHRMQFYEALDQIDTSGELSFMQEAQIDAAVALNQLQRSYMIVEAEKAIGAKLGQDTFVGFYHNTAIPYATGLSANDQDSADQNQQIFKSNHPDFKGESYAISPNSTIPYHFADQKRFFTNQDGDFFIDGVNVGKQNEDWRFTEDKKKRKFIYILPKK